MSTPTTEVSQAMVERAYDAFTRSFGSKPIGTNNTRDDLRAALEAALSSPPGEGAKPKGWKPTHKHVKRGSEYRLDGYGEIQTSAPIGDYCKVAIYSAADGCVWVRPVTEFEDGRFVALSQRETDE